MDFVPFVLGCRPWFWVLDRSRFSSGTYDPFGSGVIAKSQSLGLDFWRFGHGCFRREGGGVKIGRPINIIFTIIVIVGFS